MTQDAIIEGAIWVAKLGALPALVTSATFVGWLGLTTLENKTGVDQNASKNVEQDTEIAIALKEIRDARMAELLIHAEENSRLGLIEGQLELIIQQIQQ